VNTPVLSIPLDLIEVGKRLRAVDADYVAMIAVSLAERGQDTPIIVAAHPADASRYRLVAGGHRVAAAKQAGWTEIAAKVVEADELQAKLIEIDENLVRRELSALDRAVFLAERKRVYELLHPETAHGKAPKPKGSEKRAGVHTFSFSKATAARLGLNESTIRRAVARAKLPEEVRALIAGTPAADSGAEIDKLLTLKADLQMEVAKRLGGGAFRTVGAAISAIQGVSRQGATADADAQYRALMTAWKKNGNATARRRFLMWLDGQDALAAFKEAA
jgi:ParB family transcriptional regulator, chromosome partitioning protein